ncbi:GNAT family protein [Bacillus carboniphilus]|uniref:GNAT family protein n=1 Tax=Bacillus carboniphilus TaxID=86663 RepID=A0ABY9JTD8_9BACI|nr:GNAT family protein [Bacillus carboniphilus]WLR42667.1 GNAT family protein [Bacillus carboniphilus]
MIKKRDLHDCSSLFELITHHDVFPYVRHKVTSVEEYYFLTKQLIEQEEQGLVITRTIMDEWSSPIGSISLYDIQEQAGFLGTWLGKPYHGKGYNQLAKDAFFNELFFDLNIEKVFLKIRKENVRSMKACQKLPYVTFADDLYPQLMKQINNSERQYHLFKISKDMYSFYSNRHDQPVGVEHLKEA